MVEKMVKKYEGKKPSDFQLKKEMSSYCRNYYDGYDGDVLFAESDDDNVTEWYLFVETGKEYFGYSLTNEGDIIHLDLGRKGYFFP